MLSKATFARFLDEFGPFASHIHLYLSGEPLLNPRTPEFVSMARAYLLSTRLSTHLSIKKLDFAALIESGLDVLYMSIDGASSQTYPVYRVGGNFDLVMNNMNEVVKTKKQLNSRTPHLSWEFLVFKHNQHEMAHATELAERIGLDSIAFKKPYEIGDHAPHLRPADRGPFYRKTFTQTPFLEPSNFDLGKIRLHETTIERAFEKEWPALPSASLSASPKKESCPWLYQSTGIDALGRIIPCCCPPDAKHDQVFGTINDEMKDHFNTPKYVKARGHFAGASAWSLEHDGSDKPYCFRCDYDKRSEATLEDLAEYLQSVPLFHFLSPRSVQVICGQVGNSAP